MALWKQIEFSLSRYH